MVYNTQKGPNREGVFHHLRTETHPVSETLCFSLLFRKNPDDGQSPKTQYLCVFFYTSCNVIKKQIPSSTIVLHTESRSSGEENLPSFI
jgi:hypothetical protein